MNKQRIVAAVTAATLSLGSVAAFAQAEVVQDRFNQEQAARMNRAAGRPDARAPSAAPDRGSRGGNVARNDDRGNYRGSTDRGNYRGTADRGNWNGGHERDYGDRGRGAGPDHAFYRGGRLPPEYRSHQYVVDDWRGHHLSAPPRGYHWVQAGGDYVLAAIATGIIASVLLNQ